MLCRAWLQFVAVDNGAGGMQGAAAHAIKVTHFGMHRNYPLLRELARGITAAATAWQRSHNRANSLMPCIASRSPALPLSTA